LIDFSLYLITDRRLFAAPRSLFSAIEDALKAGVKAVQLREKNLPIRELLEMAYRMRELTGKYRARLFINDRVDIALSVEADGVHLGQSGIPVHAVRNMVKEEFIIGASTHGVEEATTAEREGADFITFGPLFETPSKLKYGAPLGIDALREVRERVSIPLLGIGGITQGKVREVMNSGAFGVALISGILGEADIRGAAEHYLKIVQQFPRVPLA
jgi:thiamine-phosphate pyrophosphorylase